MSRKWLSFVRKQGKFACALISDGYPRNPKRTNYFQKIKGVYRPAVRAAHVEPAQTEEPEAPAHKEADDGAEEDNYEDLLTSLD